MEGKRGSLRNSATDPGVPRADFILSKGEDSMTASCQKIKRFVVGEEGATMVEYGLMLALIAIVCIVAVGTIGTSTSALFPPPSRAHCSQLAYNRSLLH